MTDHQKQLREMAKLAIDNAETAAQLEIKDAVLRDALIDNIAAQLSNAYQLAACA
jgi:hypothetical protein